MMYGHHAKQKMGAVVGLCNRSGKPAVAAAKRIPGGREPDLAITPVSAGLKEQQFCRFSGQR